MFSLGCSRPCFRVQRLQHSCPCTRMNATEVNHVHEQEGVNQNIGLFPKEDRILSRCRRLEKCGGGGVAVRNRREKTLSL